MHFCSHQHNHCFFAFNYCILDIPKNKIELFNNLPHEGVNKSLNMMTAIVLWSKFIFLDRQLAGEKSDHKSDHIAEKITKVITFGTGLKKRVCGEQLNFLF